MPDPISLSKKLRGNSTPGSPGYFGAASFGFNRWTAILEEGQTIEDALKDTFWGHVADKVKGFDKTKPAGKGDIIEVRSFDLADYCELYIVAVSNGALSVRLMRMDKAVEPVAIAEDSPLDIKWNVGKRAYDVIRKEGREVVSSGHQTKQAAAGWIADTLKRAA